MGKQKVALVLSMGGARGIAHIGVIEELLRHNYEITSIAGSSMGAMVGAMYASGKLEECKEWLYSWDKRKMWELADLTLSRDGLVKGDRFIHCLPQGLGTFIPGVIYNEPIVTLFQLYRDTIPDTYRHSFLSGTTININVIKNGLPNPEKSDSPVNPKTIPMKHCVLL